MRDDGEGGEARLPQHAACPLPAGAPSGHPSTTRRQARQQGWLGLAELPQRMRSDGSGASKLREMGRRGGQAALACSLPPS